MKKTTEKKKKNPFKIILSIIGWAIIVLFVGFIVVTVIDQQTGYNMSLFGYRISVVSSESMSYVNEDHDYEITSNDYRLDKGDMVLLKEYDSFDDIELYDIVAYYNGSTLVVHRVIDMYDLEEIQYVVTQGDANNTSDGLISYNQIKGKVVGHVKYIGYVTLYLQSPYGLLAISSIALIIIITAIVVEIMKKKEELRSEEDSRIDIINL